MHLGPAFLPRSLLSLLLTDRLLQYVPAFGSSAETLSSERAVAESASSQRLCLTASRPRCRYDTSRHGRAVAPAPLNTRRARVIPPADHSRPERQPSVPRQTGCCHEPPTPPRRRAAAAAADDDDTEAVWAGLRRHRNGAGVNGPVLD